jgi:hypothetical protein
MYVSTADIGRQKLENDGNVKLVFNAHAHVWSSAVVNGIHYYGLPALKSANSYATVKIMSNYSLKIYDGGNILKYSQ